MLIILKKKKSRVVYASIRGRIQVSGSIYLSFSFLLLSFVEPLACFHTISPGAVEVVLFFKLVFDCLENRVKCAILLKKKCFI
jgi:hypothetical protein